MKRHTSLVIAATALSGTMAIPIIIIFQRHFVQGMTQGAVK